MDRQFPIVDSTCTHTMIISMEHEERTNVFNIHYSSMFELNKDLMILFSRKACDRQPFLAAASLPFQRRDSS